MKEISIVLGVGYSNILGTVEIESEQVNQIETPLAHEIY